MKVLRAFAGIRGNHYQHRCRVFALDYFAEGSRSNRPQPTPHPQPRRTVQSRGVAFGQASKRDDDERRLCDPHKTLLDQQQRTSSRVSASSASNLTLNLEVTNRFKCPFSLSEKNLDLRLQAYANPPPPRNPPHLLASKEAGNGR